jgi:hypothetical protein
MAAYVTAPRVTPFGPGLAEIIRRWIPSLVGLSSGGGPAAVPKTVIPSPNSRLRELILRAAELAAVTDSLDEDGRLGPHELVLALVADRGHAGDLLQEFKVKKAEMVG